MVCLCRKKGKPTADAVSVEKRCPTGSVFAPAGIFFPQGNPLRGPGIGWSSKRRTITPEGGSIWRKYHLLSVQITDREGRVQPLTIPAPPRWESTGPTQDMVPFSVCQVWAEHPGYTALRVDGVQIFSGEETDQDMELIPLAEGQHSLVDSSILNTSPQNL